MNFFFFFQIAIQHKNGSGQLTASGVSAVDFAWHVLKEGNFTLDVGEIDRSESNVTPNFWWSLHKLNTTGRCSVSYFCFPPEELLNLSLEKLIEKAGSNLEIYYNTVIKEVFTDKR